MNSWIPWKIHLASTAVKAVKRASAKDRKRLVGVLQQMKTNPFQGDVQQLKNIPHAFRRRIGAWRILFEINPARRLIMVQAVIRRSTTTYSRR